jgi:hypothetical protein
MVLEVEENLIESKRMIRKDFLDMKAMVEELYREQRKNGEGPSQVKDEEGGGDPPQTPPPSTSSSPPTSPYQKGKPENIDSKLPLLKLDVKFDFLMYNGNLDAKKIDNWIKQIELYCRIQRIVDEGTKV